MSKSVSRVGFWSAVVAALSSLAFDITAFTSGGPSLEEWRGIETYAATFRPIHLLSLVPSIFLALSFLIMMVSLQHVIPPDRKIWIQGGLAFTGVYAVMVIINYWLQLTSVRLSLLNGETDGLAVFVMGNPHSVFYALTGSYIVMGLAMVFAAPAFAGGKLELWIRWLFAANAVSVIAQIYGQVSGDFSFPIFAAFGVWAVTVLLACALVAVLFKRVERIAQ